MARASHVAHRPEFRARGSCSASLWAPGELTTTEDLKSCRGTIQTLHGSCLGLHDRLGRVSQVRGPAIIAMPPRQLDEPIKDPGFRSTITRPVDRRPF